MGPFPTLPGAGIYLSHHLGGFYEFVVGAGFDGNRLFDESLEKLASIGGGSAIETECEFVQVVIELISGHSSLVSSEQPTLEQSSNSVHPGHDEVVDLTPLTVGNASLVTEAHLFQSVVAPAPISEDFA